MQRAIVANTGKRWAAPGIRMVWLVALIALATLSTPVFAQLNGTYTVGGVSPNYATIDAAVTALNGGVSGPVTFLIRGGTYTPPSGGWRLRNVPGLNPTNTVTFKPDAGATVILQGNTGSFNQSGVFTMDGAQRYIIDGSNTNGGTSKDMTIIQLEVNYNPAIFFKNNADFNVVKNCNLQATGQSYFYLYGIGVVYFAGGTPNDNNTIQNCVIGDPTGARQAYMGVGMYGPSTAARNTNNTVIDCDIINFRYGGVWVDLYNQAPIIRGNQIHSTVASPLNSLYGVYINETNGQSIDATIDRNRIYKLMGTGSPSMQLMGIYLSSQNVLSGTTTITNNMISLSEPGYVYLYGIYLFAQMSGSSNTYTYNVYNNSLYFGGRATSFAQTYPFYRYAWNSSGLPGIPVVNHKNNVYYSTRSGGTSTSYGLYVYSSPATGWNSNNNLININSDNNYYTAYYNFSLYQTLASYKTSGQDVASVGSNPQFVDPVNGDLHIDPTRRTPVEGLGTPIAGITTDFDGDTRNATTPDIGADEGTFTPPLAIDASADRFHTPLANSIIRSNLSFSPIAYVENAGTTTQTVPIRLRILNASNTVVYNDLQNYVINGLTPQRVTFNSFGNNGGSTSLAVGTYTVELSTSLAGDGDASNNILTTQIFVKDQMNGVYTINPFGSDPRNFTTFTAAFTDLAAVGVTGPVIFKVATGVYDATTEAFPIRLGMFPGMNNTNTVTIKADSNSYPTIVISNVGRGAIEIDDGDYYTIDGSNTVGGTTRDFKVMNIGGGPALRFVNGAQWNVVKNMHFIGNSVNLTGIVHFAGTSNFVVGNSNNTLRSNTIGDSAGVYRSFTNVYLTGDFSYRNVANRVEDNDIINFGTTVNGGGYGIYLGNYADQVKIFSNRISMPVKAGVSLPAAYAIFISNFYNTNDSIAYNRIFDLGTSLTTTTQAGVFASSVGQSSPVVIHSNSIYLTGNSGSLYGVYLGTGSPSTYQVSHNTIYLRGTMTGTNYLSAGVRTTSSSNLTLRNNIIINERTYPTTVGNYTLYRGSNSGSFSSDYNILFTSGTGTGIGYNFGSTYTALSNWKGIGYDINSMSGRPPFVNSVAGDFHIDPVPIFNGEGMGLAYGVTRDMDMDARDMVTPDIGADEGDFNGGGITLTYPNGGEVYLPQEPFNVLYTTNRVMSVRVEFSPDGGANWMPLASVAPTVKGNNSTPVTLPDLTTNQGKVRVISQKNIYEADTSVSHVRVVRKLKLMAPNGGENLYVGDKVYIRWDRLPGEMLADFINLEYSPNGGITWLPVVTQVAGYVDSLEWTVPNTPTTNGMVRIANREVEKFWDTSDATFMILEPTLSVTTPNGGEHYDLNQPVTVSWSSTNIATLRLEYSPDNGANWQPIATNLTASNGAYTFTPVAVPTRMALVRLTDVNRPRIQDESDGVFEVMEAKSITVTTPATNDQLVRGSTTVITWDAPRIDYVNIYYSPNNGGSWQQIANNVVAAQGSYVWTVPNQITQQGKIRIQEAAGVTNGESGIFWIIDPTQPTITVISPNGGEKYIAGDTVAVRWSASDVSSVSIHYSSDNGMTWNAITGGVPAGTGEIKWVAPNKPSHDYRVRVSSASPAVSDMSNAAFEVARKLDPKIIVLYPNGGENLTVDSVVQIRWTSQDLTGPVSIEFTHDGNTWSPVGTSSSTSHMWKVPNNITTQGMIRISRQSQSVTDASDSLFEISRRVVPPIIVLSPNGGEKLQMNKQEIVRWSVPPGVSAVDLEFSTDGGGSWSSIEANVGSVVGTNQYLWRTPNMTNDLVGVMLVKVTNSADPGHFDISDSVFSMQHVAGIGHVVAGMSGLRLLGNYPNPFAGRTEIRWEQGRGAGAEIRLYQQSGALVGVYEVGHREAGEQRYDLRVQGLASGVYIYEVRAGDRVERSVLMVVR